MKKLKLNKILSLFGVIFISFLLSSSLSAQHDTLCSVFGDVEYKTTFLTGYGTAAGLKNSFNKTDILIGHPLVSVEVSGVDTSTVVGLMSELYLPPKAPFLTISQGDFPDRIQLSWVVDKFSPNANEFRIFRDGALLGKIEGDLRQFVDFNVQAGEMYEYSIVSISGNDLKSLEAKGLGFVNPNGVVSGKVTAPSGNPIPGVLVKIEPTFGSALEFDGVDDYVCLRYDDNLPTSSFTFSTWVKLGDNDDGEFIIDLGSDIYQNWWLRASDPTEPKGVTFGIANGLAANVTEQEMEFDEDPDGWHHIAAVYNGTAMTLYLDGDYRGSSEAALDTAKTRFTLGRLRGGDSKFFEGSIDDVRIYNRALSQTEILLSKDVTVSSREEGLVGYWKFDEGIGQKVFDISDSQIDGLMFGGTFSSDAAQLVNAGITDVEGNYLIEGIDYSQEQRFTALPSKKFYDNFSLEFNAANNSNVVLPAFDLPDTTTIEVVVLPFDRFKEQSILSYGTGDSADFDLYVKQDNYFLRLNGETQQLTSVSGEFDHITLVMDGGANSVTVYLNGTDVGVFNYASITGDWSNQGWVVGAEYGNDVSRQFSGLVDEIAIFDTLYPANIIANHAGLGPNGGVSSSDPHMYAYYNFNESSGTKVLDFGPEMMGDGTIDGAVYSFVARRQKESGHAFEPNSRKLNLNNTSTSVSGVDFVDISTVPITGVVRYEDTFCYGDTLIEILVNGASAFPPIFLKEDGTFSADFEPGSNVTLTPKFDGHTFLPAFYEIRRLNVAVANVLFQDQTKREITGQVFGGECRKSIVPVNAAGEISGNVKVKVRSQNGCYENIFNIENPNGKYDFAGLPPIPLTVSVVEHSVSEIYDYFQLQGGEVLDMRSAEKDTSDFMYISSPNVEIGEAKGFIQKVECTDSLSFQLLKQVKDSTTDITNEIRVFQDYIGGKCYLDTFSLDITNQIEGSMSEHVSDTSVYVYSYYANNVNVLPPYTNSFQVVAEVNEATATEIFEAVVIGDRKLESTFTTSSPDQVFAVLHDPPGDESSATWAEGTELCNSITMATSFEAGVGREVGADFGETATIYKGTPVGGTIDEIGFKNENSVSTTVTASLDEENTLEFCNVIETEISTSDGDDIWGEDADIIYGASINFEIGALQRLLYDADQCRFIDTTILTVNPDGYDTEFFYTVWQVKTVIIPQLYSLMTNADTLAAQRWEMLLEQNHNRNNSFDAVQNYSFDAATSVTISEEMSKGTSESSTIGIDISGEFVNTVGAVGFLADAYITTSISVSGGEDQTIESSTTETTFTSYTLGDDDLNDFYSVDVGKDPTYGTPIFRLKGGESMCPWIPGTRNREEVQISVDRPTAINVPANTDAVYRLNLASIGPNGVDGLIYELGVEEDGNPDGAIIKVDGQPLISPIQFQFIGEQSFQKTLTIEKPDGLQFDFENLRLYFGSACQIEHSESVGYDPADNGSFLIYQEFADPANGGTGIDYQERFYKNLILNAHFIEPCSPVDIGFPLEGHVVTPGNEVLSITLNEYQNEDPDLELIRVQYRPVPGDGSWINISEIPVAELANDPLFKIQQWDMSELSDGFYQIRALTQCFDVSLAPGMSTFITVQKETQNPSIFGVPEPADGIYTVGDEISITFDEAINCKRIFDADGIGSNININNIALINTETGDLVPWETSCRDNKIVLIPAVDTKTFDGKVLRAIANNIEDNAGNESDSIVWEFILDINPLRWEAGSNIREVKQVDVPMAVTRNIMNNSGSPRNFTIKGNQVVSLDGAISYESIPSWIQIEPRSGTLEPGEILPISLLFPQNLLVGDYLSDINVVGDDDSGNSIVSDLKVRCPGPDWDFDREAEFENTMTFAVQLDIFGEVSIDNSDRVAAFINDELRGVANVEFVEAFEGIDNNGDGLINDEDISGAYMAFLTVYGDETDFPSIDFNVFDGSNCIVYSEVVENIDYIPTAQEGTPKDPTVLHVENVVDRKIPIANGWSWISFNLDLIDNSADNVLNTLQNKTGDLIKDDNTFAEFAAGSWIGSLNDLGFEKRYLMFSEAEDTICLTGVPYDVETSTIDIEAGWNWIGFVPQQGLLVDDALSSLDPLEGDIVKSQTAFAQFIPTFGWIGNLNVMEAPNGYLLNISNAGVLDYDVQLSRSRTKVGLNTKSMMNPYWDVETNLFQHNMNITAVINSEQYDLNENDQIGVFVDGELRGYGQAVYAEPLQQYLLFITASGNIPNELLEFKLFSERDSTELVLKETMFFKPDDVVGDVMEPFMFNLLQTNTAEVLESVYSLNVYPNPSTSKFNIDLEMPNAENVNIIITDALGKVVDRMERRFVQGRHSFEFNASTLPSGIYNLSLKGETIDEKRRLIKID